jgi:hypothetical protein
MPKRSLSEKRKFISKEKTLDKLHSRILIAAKLLWIIYHSFFYTHTLGTDTRYTWLIVITPLCIGLGILAVYRRNFLITKISAAKQLPEKLVLLSFYILEGLFASYFILVFSIELIWNHLNYQTAIQNITEHYTCPVTKINNSRTSIYVDFDFKERNERVYISYKTYKTLNKNTPEKYNIAIDVNKGMWNYYIVKNYTITDKN